MNKQERRKENYNKLLEYGFKPEEARRYRDFSKSKINDVIGQRQPEPPHKKTRGIEYVDVNNARKHYLSRYSYVTSYVAKINGVKEKKFITITSATKMSKKDILLEARETILDDETESIYNPEYILISTLNIEMAVINREG